MISLSYNHNTVALVSLTRSPSLPSSFTSWFVLFCFSFFSLILMCPASFSAWAVCLLHLFFWIGLHTTLAHLGPGRSMGLLVHWSLSPFHREACLQPPRQTLHLWIPSHIKSSFSSELWLLCSATLYQRHQTPDEVNHVS